MYTGIEFKCRSSKGRLQLSRVRLHLKPYWGKPNVRNFRGRAGNMRMSTLPLKRTENPYCASLLLSKDGLESVRVGVLALALPFAVSNLSGLGYTTRLFHAKIKKILKK